MFTSSIRVIGAQIVDAKLLAAAPRILETNRLMVEAMFGEIKPIVEAQTPIGPGHFGYHLKDTYVTDVKTAGVKTIGVLKSPAQGYWREYGTVSRFSRKGSLRGYTAALGGMGSGGERALMIAHKALNSVRRLINEYYGGLATWWRA